MTGPSTQTTPPTAAGAVRGRGPGRLLLPALCFVAGGLLGGAAVATASLGPDVELQDSGGPRSSAGAAADGPTTSAPRPDPAAPPAPAGGACALAGERALAVVELGEDAAAALAALDARALEEVVDRMQELEPLVRASVADCRAGDPAPAQDP